MTMLADGVAAGYNAKLDDLAIKPILDYNYGSAGDAKHTNKATTNNAGRQELLYDTLEDAIDDLAKRADPVTKKKIDPSGSYLLCSGNVARHAARVVNGLPQTEGNKRLGAISEIAGIVAYDGDTIPCRDGDKIYDGVDTCYLVKPNRYMDIIVKRGLTTEIDTSGRQDPCTGRARLLFRRRYLQQRGLANFVQKITLPTW